MKTLLRHVHNHESSSWSPHKGFGMEARNTVTNVWYTSSKCPETHGSDRDGLNRAEVLAGNPIKQQGTYGQEETDSIKKKKFLVSQTWS